MRILNVINVRWFNATAWYAVSLSLALKRKGHNVAVCGLPGTPPVLKARDNGLEVFEAGINKSDPIRILSGMGAMDRVFQAFDPEIVICHRGEFYGYFAYRRATKQKYKLIRVRGDIRPPKGGKMNRLLHNRCTDAIVCSGDFISKQYQEILNTPEYGLHTIYGGVDVAKFFKNDSARSKVRSEFGYSDDDFVVGIVGRFDPIKGHENLIKAVSYLKNNGKSNIKLLIAGFDAVSQTDAINNYLAENGISDISVITGFREDIADIYNALDVCVVSSLGSEAICRVGMEAMACGVPLITSDTGVLPEISKNVYPKDDWKALAEKLMNFDTSTTIYDLDSFADRFENLF